MNSGELLVSNESFIRIFIVIAYVPLCLISARLLFPGLSPSAKRLGIGMLALQILVVALSEIIQPTSIFEERLWALDREFNIPSTFASTQLALAGGLALLTASLARARPALFRLYLAGLGLSFLYLALDEFFAWKDLGSSRTWKINVSILGAAIVLGTIALAPRASRRARIWHFCLLTGLALVAIAAVVVDDLPPFCGDLGLIVLEDCLDYRIPEEIIEFLGIWLALVAMLGHFSDATRASSPPVQRSPYVLPVIWIALILLVPLIPRFEMQLLAQPAAVKFDKRIQLKGYRIDSEGRGPLNLRLYATASAWDWNHIGRREVGYSLHLIDQASGESFVSRNALVRPQFEILMFGSQYEPIYREYAALEIPPTAPANRALWVVLTFWRERDGEYEQMKVLSSDLKLLGDAQVVLDELVLPDDAPTPATAPLARFDNGFSLGAAELPEVARPGENLAISFTWRSSENGSEDHAQFLHLGNVETGQWVVYDQEPLGPRLPTRFWYSGLADSETWRVPLPADLAPGRYQVFTGLYRMGDQERVSAADAEGRRFVDARAPLGYVIIRSLPP
ncbi:MAG: hypothetical protein OXI40_14450 [Chloroflexota bacterium]|nr:hypothetical protein [Chloroflexota bacterium]